MTDDTKLLHTWNNQLNRLASARARLKAIPRSLGETAAEFDYKQRIKTGKQPFSPQDDAI